MVDMLEITSISTFYGNIQALRDVSLHVKENEIVTLIGANGAGKTTILHTISGLATPREGRISFLGRDIIGMSAEQIVGLGICLVAEGRQIFRPMTVMENLELGAYLRFRKEDKKAIYKDIDTMFQLFPRLEERIKQVAGTLSGGEQQMLVIARALMSKPKLLLLDEPSTGLAPMLVREIFNKIVELRAKNTTVLMVEQNARASLQIADRCYVMETGKVILEGSSTELLENQGIKHAYLGKAQKAIWER